MAETWENLAEGQNWEEMKTFFFFAEVGDFVAEDEIVAEIETDKVWFYVLRKLGYPVKGKNSTLTSK